MAQKFSLGIEKILIMAKLDDKFHEKLLNNREKALESCRVELTVSEIAILLSASEDQLRDAILAVKPPEKARRAFIVGGLAAVAVVLGATVLIPSFLTAKVGSRPGSVALRNIQTVLNAQKQYKRMNGRYGTLQELADNNYIDQILGSGKKGSYKYTISNLTENTWQLRAIHQIEGGRSFFVDESGVIRYSETKKAGPDSEPME